MYLIALPIVTFSLVTIFFGVGIYFVTHWYSCRGWESLEGEIVSVRETAGGSDGFTYEPVIRVSLGGGEQEFQSEHGCYPAPKIGDRRRVLYDPVSGRFTEFSISIIFFTVILPILLGLGAMKLGWSTYEHNMKSSNKQGQRDRH